MVYDRCANVRGLFVTWFTRENFCFRTGREWCKSPRICVETPVPYLTSAPLCARQQVGRTGCNPCLPQRTCVAFCPAAHLTSRGRVLLLDGFALIALDR